MLTHELTHFLLMPSGNKVFGLWPARAMAYVHRPGDLSDLSRARVLAIMLGPFVLISVLPLMLAAFGVEVNAWIIWVSIWNTLGSSFDLQMAVGVLRRK